MKTAKFFSAVLFFILIAPLRIDAQIVNLRYEGAWTNLTFGSTGAAHITATLDVPNATINFDLDGFVFGAADPPLITFPGTISNGILTVNSKGAGTYGDVSGTINLVSGDTSMNIVNVPNPRIADVQLKGTVSANKVNLQYTVDFPGSSTPAVGVLIADPVPPLQITSINVNGGQLVVNWTGGIAPYQLQTASAISPAGWQNSGGTTATTSAQIPIGNAKQIFVRVSGK